VNIAVLNNSDTINEQNLQIVTKYE